MKPTTLCNTGITSDSILEQRTHTGECHHSKTYPRNARPQCCVHTPIRWHRVDCCYCSCYPFLISISFSPLPKKHHLYVYFSLNDKSGRTCHEPRHFLIAHFISDFSFKEHGTNRNGTLKGKTLSLTIHKKTRQFMGRR